MFRYLYGESVAALAEGRSFSWRAYVHAAVDTVRTWPTRRRQRQELLDYMAIDHRIAADIGLSKSDALDWAERPFWHP
jgi:uncharacterized protein YjiS (DUF1127 family)